VTENVNPFAYAPALESRELVSIESSYDLFINGKFVAPKSKKRFVTINPATEEVLSKISLGGKDDLDLAVETARKGARQVPLSHRPLDARARS
jgi:aldehyde dehydrogenase (NAD+)